MIRVDIGGDDSVRGRVLFVWIEEVVAAGGTVVDGTWGTAYASQLCTRRVSDTGSTLCI